MSAKVTATVLFLSATLSVVTPGDYRFQSKNPVSVALNSTLYTVSSYDKHELVISPSGDDGKECIIDTSSANESFTGKIKAVTLYHKIAVLGKREEVITRRSRRTNYTVALIEPKGCTGYAITDLMDSVPIDYPDELPELMAHQESFDIFFPSQKDCFPCSNDLNGEPIDAREQLKPLGSPGAPFYLREFGTTGNYVYLYNFDNGTAAIKSINGTFEDRFDPPKQLTINATVNNLVVKQGNTKPLLAGITYVSQNSPRRPHFLLFDEDLEVVFSAHLPLLDKYNLVDTSIAIDSDGYSYVILVQQFGETRKITRVVYSPYGQIKSNLEIDDLEPKIEYKVQSFVNATRFSLVVHQLSGKLETKIKSRSKSTFE